MTSDQLQKKRREALRSAMDSAGLNVPDLVAAVYPQGGDEATTLKAHLYQARGIQSRLTVRAARLIAPALGVDPETLIVEETDFESKRGKGSNGRARAPATQRAKPEAISDDIKRMRAQALDGLMTDRRITATQLAAAIEPDDYEQSLLAMKIADARQGEEALTSELAIRIAQALEVDPQQTFGVEATATTPSPKPQEPTAKSNDSPKRRRQDKAAPAASSSLPVPAATPAVMPHITSTPGSLAPGVLGLDVPNISRIFGHDVQILPQPDGTYLLRAERQVSQAELLEILLQQLAK